MLKIGLTGNMGSGKTTICRVFEILGIPVFYADTEAKKLFALPGIQQSVREIFGDEVFNPNGQPNTKVLAAKAFSDKELLSQLNNIIHPAVYHQFEHWVHQQQNAPYIIQEAAILFETGAYKRFDYTLLVYAPENLMVERVIKRDNMPRQQVLERLAHQMEQERKRELAHWVIFNDSQSLVIPQVLEIHKQLQGLKNQG